MTKEELIKFYTEKPRGYTNLDTLRKHILADGTLCELLIALDYGEVVKEYDKLYNNSIEWY